MSWGGLKNEPHNNKINNTINTTPSISQILEEEKKDIYCVNIEEFKSFLNEWKNKELYPWRDFEKNIVDCWLFYELTWKKIKKMSSELIFGRWQTGGKKEIREEEKKNWEESQKKRERNAFNEINAIDEEKQKKAVLKIKKEVAIKFLEENPEKKAVVEELSTEKALVQARGNKELATRLKPYIYYNVAYELSSKIY